MRQGFDRFGQTSVVSAKEFEQLVVEQRETHLAADDLIATAHAEAEKVLAEARAEAAAILNRVREDVTAELKTTMQARAAERQAQYFLTIDAEVNKIRAAFESMTPWLRDTVLTAVERIIGDLNDEELLSRAVAEAARSFDRSFALTLLVNPADQKKYQALFTQFPDQFATVTAIKTDDDVSPATCRLSANAGTVTVDLQAQLAEIEKILTQQLSAEETGAIDGELG